MPRRDLRRLTGGFLAILAGLWLTGLLDFRAAAGAGLLTVFLAYILNARNGSLPDLPAEQKPAPSVETRPDPQQALIYALPQPALIIRDQHIRAFNESAGQLFSLAEGVPPPVAGLRNPDILAAVAEVQAGREARACEIIPARFPEQHWLVEVIGLDIAHPQQDILVVLSDQAPVRKAERARADFLANASHELRTPLTSISGFVETMQGAAKDDKDAWPRFIDIIAGQASHMRGLITDLLSLSRIELGEHEEPDTRVDLLQILSESVEAMNHAATGQGLNIVLEPPETVSEDGGDLSIMASEIEVKQVIQNLVGNALKYSPAGGTVMVRVGRGGASAQKLGRTWQGANRVALLSSTFEAAETDTIWLSVRDDGEGIEPEFLPRLGERFFRVDASRGGPVEGTGLGLAIVKHIMAHHRGGLAVESVVGEGTQFTVWFKRPEGGDVRSPLSLSQ
ncbi:MAG: ATP-binding protein [Hyphomonadaceae bacterium]